MGDMEQLRKKFYRNVERKGVSMADNYNDDEVIDQEEKKQEKFCFPRFITVRYRIIQKKEGR